WFRRDREKRLGGVASVQAGPTSKLASQGFTAAATISGVMLVMQRWSVGQRRKKHGLQYGLSCTMLLRGVTGAVPSGSVGPKTATTGTPTAAATCIAPESLPRNSWHCERRAGKSPIPVFPVRSTGFFLMPAMMALETPASAAVPNKITSASFSA